MEWKNLLGLASKISIDERFRGIDGVSGSVQFCVDVVGDDSGRERGAYRWASWRVRPGGRKFRRRLGKGARGQQHCASKKAFAPAAKHAPSPHI
jgi:hypothetical protein